MQRWRRRSQLIRLLRRGLPVVIVLVVVLLVAWIAGQSLFIKATAPKPPQATGLRMLNPKFYGRDSANHAFVLGATEAARDASTGKSVALSAPNLTLDAGGARTTTVQANKGVYHEDQRQLALILVVDALVRLHRRGPGAAGVQGQVGGREGHALAGRGVPRGLGGA